MFAGWGLLACIARSTIIIPIWAPTEFSDIIPAYLVCNYYSYLHPSYFVIIIHTYAPALAITIIPAYAPTLLVAVISTYTPIFIVICIIIVHLHRVGRFGAYVVYELLCIPLRGGRELLLG